MAAQEWDNQQVSIFLSLGLFSAAQLLKALESRIVSLNSRIEHLCSCALIHTHIHDNWKDADYFFLGEKKSLDNWE